MKRFSFSSAFFAGSLFLLGLGLSARAQTDTNAAATNPAPPTPAVVTDTPDAVQAPAGQIVPAGDPGNAGSQQPGQDIYDIRPPFFFLRSWLWLWLALAAVGLIALLIFLWSWFRPEKQLSPRTAYEQTLERLAKARALLREDDPMPYAVLVSETIRGYLGQRFQSPSTRRTTEEFLRQMEADSSTPLAGHRDLLRDFLQSCDLVKFARYQPTLAELEKVHERAVTFVTNQTGAGSAEREATVSTFQFAHTWAIFLLPVLILLAILRGRRGKEAAVQYSSLSLLGPLVRGRKIQPGGWLAALRYFSLFFLLIALARPQKVDTSTQVQGNGIDMMLAIDLSPSMEALDFHKDGQEISRVEVVRETVGQFIQARPNDRIGMVAFAGEAYLMSPLTLDHDWLLQNVERLRVGLAGDATAIGSAIATSANRLRDQQSKSKIIILLTDGANNAGKITPYAAAEAAQALGIKIYTIGAASSDVAKFPTRNMFGQRVYTTIPVDIDEGTMRKIADITGGKFYRATDTETLRRVYAEINQLETSKVTVKRFQHVKEYFAWALYPGLLCLGLEIFLAHTRWRRVP